ncbi:hypothetical protein PHLGIDRAFT_166017 [Phlebiopsis gigantea 11061_1 CR5-6]|uniref:Uncharacterized protein n=1 Tax=Phlebiopsis gigantea (strain 11061_1 CR5-6) TaxID=745531 RepID=A0A0C3RV76_PHLG1|nr:hypothetical protein PHLGIDRAFT_166017 [Phlebiopsis gigantea 11061_1 CR5-6]
MQRNTPHCRRALTAAVDVLITLGPPHHAPHPLAPPCPPKSLHRRRPTRRRRCPRTLRRRPRRAPHTRPRRQRRPRTRLPRQPLPPRQRRPSPRTQAKRARPRVGGRRTTWTRYWKRWGGRRVDRRRSRRA